jgi:hypothetical protein
VVLRIKVTVGMRLHIQVLLAVLDDHSGPLISLEGPYGFYIAQVQKLHRADIGLELHCL